MGTRLGQKASLLFVSLIWVLLALDRVEEEEDTGGKRSAAKIASGGKKVKWGKRGGERDSRRVK